MPASQQTFYMKDQTGKCQYNIQAGSIDLYQKPYNKFRVVDWCIWIDYIAKTQIYEGIELTEADTERFYKGIYFLTISICKKRNYFKTAKDYDNFAMEFAADIYGRYFHSGQYRDENPLEKMRSVKNYVAQILYARKVGYEQREYVQIDYAPTTVGEVIQNSDPSANKVLAMNKSMASLAEVEYNEYIKDAYSIIVHIICASPYGNDKVIKNRLYLSILLTLTKWQSMVDKKKINLEPVLYHLSDDFHDYIIVLSKRCINAIKTDVLELANYSNNTYMDKTSWYYSQMLAIGRYDPEDLKEV